MTESLAMLQTNTRIILEPKPILASHQSCIMLSTVTCKLAFVSLKRCFWYCTESKEMEFIKKES